MTKLMAATAVALTLAAYGMAEAKTFRFSSSGDINGLDPHLNNEAPTNAMKNNVYETLIFRDYNLKLLPALATEWKQTDPTTWRFKLREGVKFHDGTPFTADDVVFSVKRNQHEQGAMRTASLTIKEVRKVDATTIDIVTEGPNPILDQDLTSLFIMSKPWAEKNNTATPVRGIVGNESYANTHTNGTGPFKILDRVPDTRTVLVPNPDWWNKKPDHNLTRIEFRPIANAATRVAALLSGEIDMMYPVPLQDIPRIERTAGIKVLQGPELRVVFLGMDQWRPELLDMPGSGKNPFKDKRVRQAFYQAIDAEAIKRVVMRGVSIPTGQMVGRGATGYSKELESRYPFDPDGAKKLLADAGYPNGFGITLDCSNDRYVNDEAICQAVVGMLAQAGIKVDLAARSKTLHFPKLQKKDTSFFLLGWGVPTFDSHYVFSYLVQTPDGKNGSWNFTNYSNPKLDGMINGMLSELDATKRDKLIRDAWDIINDEVIYLPLHHQVLNWAMAEKLDMPIIADNVPRFHFAKLK